MSLVAKYSANDYVENSLKKIHYQKFISEGFSSHFTFDEYNLLTETEIKWFREVLNDKNVALNTQLNELNK